MLATSAAGHRGPAAARPRRASLGLAAALALMATAARPLGAQQGATGPRDWAAHSFGGNAGAAASSSTVASRAWSSARALADSAAARDARLRIVVSLDARRLYVLRGADTLRVAPAALAMPRQLAYEGRTWEFATPPGVHTVRAKVKNPVWVPPDWHYAEVAQTQALHLVVLARGQRRRLPDGRMLLVQGDRVGLAEPGIPFEALPADEEIIFGDTLYVPPLDTRNRRVYGELGPYRLELGAGYLIHGNDDESSVENGTTHGCVRVHNDDIRWLYANVPVGTPVYVY